MFTSLWRTTTSSESITLPLRQNDGQGYDFLYNFTVDWGDGSATQTVSSFDDSNATHIYTSAGDYIVTIEGIAEAWYFNNSGSKDKIISVSSFGNTGWKNLESAFLGCSNLTTFSGGITSSVNNMSKMFMDASSLTTLDVSVFDTSLVTDMSYMFTNLSSLASLDLSNFETYRVTDMQYMFSGASALTFLEISDLETRSVTNMNSMFSGVSSLGGMNLSGFETSQVTEMSNIFHSASSLAYLAVINWDLSASAGSLDVLTSTDVNMKLYCDQDPGVGFGTFFGKTCVGAPFESTWRTTTSSESITLPLRSGYNYNFTVDWGDGNTSVVTSSSDSNRIHTYALAGDYEVVIEGSLEAWYFNNTGDKDKIISVEYLGFMGWINLDNAFHGCTNLQYFAGGRTAHVTTMNSMLEGTTSLQEIDLADLNTSNVTSMSRMFANASSIEEIVMANFDTSSVTDMSNMFEGTTLLVELNAHNLDLTNAASSTNVFLNTNVNISVYCDQDSGTGVGTFFSETCMRAPFVSTWKTTTSSETITLPLRSGFTYNFTVDWGDGTGTSTVTAYDDPNRSHQYTTAGTYQIFIEGSMESFYFNNGGSKDKIISVDLFGNMGWVDLDNAFQGCTNLESFSGGYTSNVTTMSHMFEGSSSLKGLDLSDFNTTSVSVMDNMFQNTTDLKVILSDSWEDVTITPASGIDIFQGKNPDLYIFCDQGGSPGTGDLFGETCH